MKLVVQSFIALGSYVWTLSFNRLLRRSCCGTSIYFSLPARRGSRRHAILMNRTISHRTPSVNVIHTSCPSVCRTSMNLLSTTTIFLLWLIYQLYIQFVSLIHISNNRWHTQNIFLVAVKLCVFTLICPWLFSPLLYWCINVVYLFSKGVAS